MNDERTHTLKLTTPELAFTGVAVQFLRTLLLVEWFVKGGLVEEKIEAGKGVSRKVTALCKDRED